MKIPRRVNGSVCSAVLSKNRASAAVTATASARRTFSSSKEKTEEPKKSRLGSDFFCARSSQWLLSTFAPSADARQAVRAPSSRDASQTYSTAVAAVKPPPFQTTPPSPERIVRDKKELMSFIGGGEIKDVEEHLNFYKDPYRSGYAQADGPTLQISDKRQDVEYPSKEETFKINNELRQVIARLCSAISHRLRQPHRHSLDPIYKLYLQLPEPRMLYLTWQWRDRLLKAMGTPERRDTESMLRYFALVADVKNAGLTMRRSQWNFAIAFATKYAARISAAEMESGLRLWREMEHDANVKGNEVTFHILFDVASKSGNFQLADMIYKEMDSRGLPFNRYHHVSLIHYFGLKLDSEGVRAAYKDMVDAGEMIDTVVLNCVISGFLRCGEEPAAELIYDRMKKGYTMAPEMPERNYLIGRVVTKVLMMFTKVGKKHPELKKMMQKNIQLGPDLHTYKLMIEHYAVRMGNIAKVAQYLDEMRYLRIPIHPSIFLALFKGFYTHGGYSSSEWNQQRLEGVLNALYQARDEGVRSFRIDRWLVIWALRAMQKCAKNDAVIRTFDSMAARWDIPPERQAFMHNFLENITNGSDMKSSLGKFEGPSHSRYRKDGARL